MAKPRPGKPEPEPAKPTELRLLPMQLPVGDRLRVPSGEWEIAARPYPTNTGKTVHARVRRVDDPKTVDIRSWSALERIAVRRV